MRGGVEEVGRSSKLLATSCSLQTANLLGHGIVADELVEPIELLAEVCEPRVRVGRNVAEHGQDTCPEECPANDQKSHDCPNEGSRMRSACALRTLKAAGEAAPALGWSLATATERLDIACGARIVVGSPDQRRIEADGSHIDVRWC